jgi:hypothetical protein
VGVFLRWGVFGILAVAALLYAYNSSKRLAERQSPAAIQSASPPEAEAPPIDATVLESSEDPTPPQCQVELRVATRALQARRDQEPMDKLMRMQDILFEADASRRLRLEKVARDWYLRDGAEPGPEALKSLVLGDCQRVSRAP